MIKHTGEYMQHNTVIKKMKKNTYRCKKMCYTLKPKIVNKKL